MKDVNRHSLKHRLVLTDVLLDHLEGILISDLDGTCHVPGNVDHGNN